MMDGERDGTHQNEIQELKFKRSKVTQVTFIGIAPSSFLMLGITFIKGS